MRQDAARLRDEPEEQDAVVRDEPVAGLAAPVARERGEAAPAPVPDREALALAGLRAETVGAAAAPVVPPDEVRQRAAANERRARAQVDAVLPLHVEPHDSLEPAREPDVPGGEIRMEPVDAPPDAAVALPLASPEPDRVAQFAEPAARRHAAQHWTGPLDAQPEDARREDARRARDTK